MTCYGSIGSQRSCIPALGYIWEYADLVNEGGARLPARMIPVGDTLFPEVPHRIPIHLFGDHFGYVSNMEAIRVAFHCRHHTPKDPQGSDMLKLWLCLS